MIEWTDEALVLAARPHGETSMIVTLLTAQHGRAAGMVTGGQSPKRAALLQAGQQVQAHWKARLPEQLGHFTLEPLAPYPAAVLDNGLALAGISSACAVAEAALPEREPHPAVYAGLLALITLLPVSDVWPYAYVQWELGLLAAVGYGIDLSCCAVTGVLPTAETPLTHISPRTGRAVCAEAAAPYLDKLLPLPAFLSGGSRGEMSPQALEEGFALSGSFLERCVFHVHHKTLPPARQRLYDRLFAAQATSQSA